MSKKIMERRMQVNMKGKRNQLESVPINIATVPYSWKHEIIKVRKWRFLDKT